MDNKFKGHVKESKESTLYESGEKKNNFSQKNMIPASTFR